MTEVPRAAEIGHIQLAAMDNSVYGATIGLDSDLVLPTTIDPAGMPGIASPSVEIARVPLSELPALTGTTFLSQLSLLPQTTLGSFIHDNPTAITNLLAAPPAATSVTGWWSALSDSTRDSLTTYAPQLVGNLDGVPAAVRDTANRAFLEISSNSLNDSLAGDIGRAEAEGARRQVHMLSELEGALGTADSVPARSLLSVDSTGAGRAAVVLGDLATADYVTYLIPGMFFTVDGQVNDWTDDAARIYDEQVSWLNLIGKTHADEATKTVAVVAWMGYETPNLTNIGSIDLAEIGRDALASTVEGLQSERAGDEPYITILAHSYGSTAALMALTEYSFEIDALAVVGSPGSPAQSVDELHVRNGNVFVGEAPWDPVPNSAFFGSDPGAASYGAHSMSVGGGVDLITNQVLEASVGHNGYFGAGTESVRNLALIGIGQGQLVTDGGNDDQEKTLALAR